MAKGGSKCRLWGRGAAWETDHPRRAQRGDPVRVARPLSARARSRVDLPTALRPAPLSLTFLPANGAAACHPHPTPGGRAGREVGWERRGLELND